MKLSPLGISSLAARSSPLGISSLASLVRTLLVSLALEAPLMALPPGVRLMAALMR
jgi:hypothetical protein